MFVILSMVVGAIPELYFHESYFGVEAIDGDFILFCGCGVFLFLY